MVPMVKVYRGGSPIKRTVCVIWLSGYCEGDVVLHCYEALQELACVVVGVGAGFVLAVRDGDEEATLFK